MSAIDRDTPLPTIILQHWGPKYNLDLEATNVPLTRNDLHDREAQSVLWRHTLTDGTHIELILMEDDITKLHKLARPHQQQYHMSVELSARVSDYQHKQINLGDLIGTFADLDDTPFVSPTHIEHLDDGFVIYAEPVEDTPQQ